MEYFIAACSGTGRMVPKGQAQRFLQFKLSIEDVEMAVNGTELDLGGDGSYGAAGFILKTNAAIGRGVSRHWGLSCFNVFNIHKV